VRNFAISEVIEMGGDEGDLINEVAGEFQFAYLIASDATVRVVDLIRKIECDTQVDPRFLKTETNVELMSCFPVGAAETPPRRSDAISPGIHLPGRYLQGSMRIDRLAVPLDVAFASVPAPDILGGPHPFTMVGTFAFITAANGRVFVANVDDDNYPDYEDQDDPLRVAMPLALAHQLRDAVQERDALATSCASPIPEPGLWGVRLADAPSLIVDPARVAPSKVDALPFMRGVACTAEIDEVGERVVPELSFAAPSVIREEAFPDLRGAESEEWALAWEGTLSSDPIDQAVDGPPVRRGQLLRDSGKAILRDESRGFCALGVEPWDIAAVIGCSEDNQCGVGEECYVHPDTSSQVASGTCLRSSEVDLLSTVCSDYLVSRKVYSVTKTSARDLELVERRRVLETSPIDGCTSNEECAEHAAQLRALAQDAHPVDMTPVDEPYTWECRTDASRAPGKDRCLMVCEESADCEAGFHCLSGECVYAPLPPRECLGVVQRFQVRVGEAFALLGRETGFLHDLVMDPATGACVPSGLGRTNLVGRVPLRVEPCDDDGDPLTGPNPCEVTIENVEDFPTYSLVNGECVAEEAGVRRRETKAIRVENTAMAMHLISLETTGDAMCRNDGAGTLAPYSTAFPGFSIAFETAGGFFPLSVASVEAAYPVRITSGPDGRLWVVDQGDISAITRGRIYKFNPSAAEAGFDVVVIL
jgi:hypothetical protein